MNIENWKHHTREAIRLHQKAADYKAQGQDYKAKQMTKFERQHDKLAEEALRQHFVNSYLEEGRELGIPDENVLKYIDLQKDNHDIRERMKKGEYHIGIERRGRMKDRMIDRMNELGKKLEDNTVKCDKLLEVG